MENNLTIKKHSSLETNPKVVEVLNWKLQALEEEARPLEEGIADYIGFTLDNLKQSTASKKFYIEELKKLIKADEVQMENIKTEGVKFLEQMGVEKLQGHIVSSVSIAKAKPSTTKTKEVLKYLVPKEEIEELLITLGKAEWETVTTTSDEIPPKLRVTARRVKNVEVVEGN
jgi:hypothetical protein